MKTTETPLLTARFERALVYAAQLHRHQLRKVTSIPYVSHLLSVAALVLEDGGNEDEAIAALLHDAVEDRGGRKTLETIREKFGDGVASIVENCSESEIIPKPPWQERKLATIERQRQASPEVRRVVLADKLHNARSILSDLHRYGEEVWSRFQGGKERTLWFYHSLIEADKEAGSSFLTDELERVVKALEKFTKQ
jgi:(p)ppGpp synthase/HD superfamily hydrolase